MNPASRGTASLSRISRSAHARRSVILRTARAEFGNGRRAHAAALALLGNYMAASFATIETGNGGALARAPLKPSSRHHLTGEEALRGARSYISETIACLDRNR
jgi:hypothetical protein